MLLWVKCAGCGDSLLPKLEVDHEQLERQPVFVLCQECYVHIRLGYQRDRDRRQLSDVPQQVHFYDQVG